MKRNLFFAIGALMIGVIAALSVFFYEYFYPKLYVKNDIGEYVNITTSANSETFPVTRDTIFQIEYYYPDEGRTLTEEIKDFPQLLGCDKNGVQRYLDSYMKRLSLDEQEKGLKSFELVSYHDNVIYLRKTYQKQILTGYFAKSYNGTVVILNGDEKTVYEYTQIPINLLPEELQEDVTEGYYLEDEKELYNFLENYSS